MGALPEAVLASYWLLGLSLPSNERLQTNPSGRAGPRLTSQGTTLISLGGLQILAPSLIPDLGKDPHSSCSSLMTIAKYLLC